jgi:hypothetical protein
MIAYIKSSNQITLRPIRSLLKLIHYKSIKTPLFNSSKSPMKSTAMKLTTSFLLLLLLPTASFAQRSKNRIAYSKQDFTPELTTYDQQLFSLNYNSMLYWYGTAQEIDSLYQLERLKVTYYAKITGIQAASYETLAEIYANKQAIEKAIATEKDTEIKDLKKRNRRLIITNTALTIGITAVAVSTIYFAIL